MLVSCRWVWVVVVELLRTADVHCSVRMKCQAEKYGLIKTPKRRDLRLSHLLLHVLLAYN